jgi:hypothetical protein
LDTHLAGEAVDEVADERVDVFGPFAKRRYGDRKHVQAVVQVVAEVLRFDHLVEMPVRRSDHSHVDSDRPRPAESLELLLLQHPEQLRLQLERDLAHLVQEERATVGHLETADLLRDGARKRPPLVTEELALEQSRRNGRAVDLDERPIATVTPIVDGTGHQLLSGPGLAEDEDGRIRRSHDLDVPQDTTQRRALADDVLESVLRRNLRSDPRCVHRFLRSHFFGLLGRSSHATS